MRQRLRAAIARRQVDTGKKTAPTLPLCLSAAEMPCRFSGIAASPPPADPANIGFYNMARRLLCQ
ncbi:hypothetical protein CCL17_01615 [Pseudomonas congelans]|nr:hypothetical protein CCL17_01615 [Pseudomonas congelans]PBQ17222.1 hypothetical protein CCL08_14520 [Pseudomonas congelans]